MSISKISIKHINVLLIAVLIGLNGIVLYQLKKLNYKVSHIEFRQSLIQSSLSKNVNREVQYGHTKGYKVGIDSAPNKMTIFVDYDCPYCRNFFQNSYPLLKKEFIEKGDLQLMIRDYPLKSHRNSVKLAMAVRRAQLTGIFDAFLSQLYETHKESSESLVNEIESRLSIEQESTEEQAASLKKLETDVSDARALGISGTPSFIINKRLHVGELKYVQIQSIMVSMMTDKGANTCE